MADPRIIAVTLDERTILWRNADIEQERRIAIYDLIEDNTFKPLRAWQAGYAGPYRLKLAVRDGRYPKGEPVDDAGRRSVNWKTKHNYVSIIARANPATWSVGPCSSTIRDIATPPA